MLVFAICWDVIGPAVLVVPFAVLVLDGLKMLAVMYTQRCISYDLVPAWVRRSAESYVKFEHKTRQSLLDEDGRTQLKRFVPSWEWMRVHRIVCVRMVATGELPLNKGDHHAHRVGDNVDCWLWWIVVCVQTGVDHHSGTGGLHRCNCRRHHCRSHRTGRVGDLVVQVNHCTLSVCAAIASVSSTLRCCPGVVVLVRRLPCFPCLSPPVRSLQVTSLSLAF